MPMSWCHKNIQEEREVGELYLLVKVQNHIICTIQLNQNHTITHSYLGFTIRTQCPNQRVVGAQLSYTYLVTSH